MKGCFTTTLTTFLSASSVAAFPSLVLENNRHTQNLVNLGKRQLLASPQGIGALPLVPPPFDAQAQYVSTTGEHAVSIQLAFSSPHFAYTSAVYAAWRW